MTKVIVLSFSAPDFVYQNRNTHNNDDEMSESPVLNMYRLEFLSVPSLANRLLLENLEKAIEILPHKNVLIEEVHDVDKFLKYGISGIPALIHNGDILFQAEFPSLEELQSILIKALIAEPT